MMANTGANILPPGDTAVLTSPVRQGTSKTECLHFWYHMGGVNPGETPSHTKHTLNIVIGNTIRPCALRRISERVCEASEGGKGEDLL